MDYYAKNPKIDFQSFFCFDQFQQHGPIQKSFLAPDLARRPFGGDFQQLMAVGSFHVGKLGCCRRIAMLVGPLPCWKVSLLKLAAMLMGFFHVGNLGRRKMIAMFLVSFYVGKLDCCKMIGM